MKVFSFDLLLRSNVGSIKRSKLRNFEKNLKSVVFSVLDIVEAKVKFCEFLEVLY